eukprot:EG_transcript_18455
MRQRPPLGPSQHVHVNLDVDDGHHPWIPTLEKVMWLAVAGTAFSIYLVRQHFSDGPSLCDINAVLSCQKVSRSRFSVLFGVPVAVWGIVWNLTVVHLSSQSISILQRDMFKDRDLVKSNFFFLMAWSIAGVGFVLYFVLAEVLVGAVCVVCTAVHALTAATAYLTRTLCQQAGVSPNPIDHAPLLQRWLSGLSLLALLLILGFNTMGSTTEAPSAKPAPLAFDLDALAKCIRDRGFVLFSSPSCVHCQEQRALLGPAVELVPTTECSGEGLTACVVRHNIQALPTWLQITDGVERRRHSGLLTLPALSNFTACPLHRVGELPEG